jgi:carotenoid 1,2-hydratase
VALYGDVKRWAMTERGTGDLHATPQRLEIGPSHMQWDGTSLTITINERCMPDQRRLCGTIRVTPPALIDHEVTLDTAGRHRWRPFAPKARVAVALESPSLQWSGTAYFDSNNGDDPLEHGFSKWSWSRASHGNDTLVLYDATRRDGTSLALARIFHKEGGTTDVAAPPEANLKTGLWGVARPTRADPGTTPSLLRRLEDAPFYTRSEIRTVLLGREAHGVHESLDLERFSQRWVQVLLPFRMPRIARR